MRTNIIRTYNIRHVRKVASSYMYLARYFFMCRAILAVYRNNGVETLMFGGHI